MNWFSRKFVTYTLRKLIQQPSAQKALIRFIYYTEEFVERYDFQPILPHLQEDERQAMLHHFKDEMTHSKALRNYCLTNGLPIEKSELETDLIRRSDEGYAQYLQHLDTKTQRFTALEMFRYYCHVAVQEELAEALYSQAADAFEAEKVHPKLVRMLRVFAKNEIGHEHYAQDFMARYEAILGKETCSREEKRIRKESRKSGMAFFRDFLRLLHKEHGFNLGLMALVT